MRNFSADSAKSQVSQGQSLPGALLPYPPQGSSQGQDGKLDIFLQIICLALISGGLV